MLAVFVLAIRNLFGFFVVLVVGALLVGAATYLPGALQSGVAYFIVWLLLFGAVRSVFELARRPGRRTTAASDAAQLAQVTRLPTAFWVAIFFLLTLGTAALGTWLLRPT
jgi:hypothetical protein